jgi:hypothetical protein
MSAIARSKVLAEFEHPSSKRGRPNGAGKVRDVHGGDHPGRGGRMPGDPHGGEQPGEGSRVIGNITNASPRKRTETTEDDDEGDTKRNKGAER